MQQSANSSVLTTNLRHTATTSTGQPQTEQDPQHFQVSRPRLPPNNPPPPNAPHYSPDLLRELQAIRAEISQLRQENIRLKQENLALRNTLATPNTNAPPAPPTPSDTDMELEASQAPPHKRKAPPPELPQTHIDNATNDRLGSIEQALTNQRQEYLQLHQTLVSTQNALQAAITDLRGEIQSCVRALTTNANLAPTPQEVPLPPSDFDNEQI